MNKNYTKFSLIFLVVGGYIIFRSSMDVFASYEYVQARIYNYNPHHRIKSYIGIKSQNRINFGNYGIKEIIGDETLYQLIHDSSGNNIFIIPKAHIGEVIDITIVSNSHKVQDLSLQILDDFGQTIVISLDNVIGKSDEK